MFRPSIKNFKNIVIIQTAFIGDLVLSLYMANAIKKTHPGAVIKYVTTPLSAPIAGCVDDIDVVHSFDKKGCHSGLKGLKILAGLISAPSTAIIAPHKSFRTTLLAKLSKPDYSVGFNNASASFLYNTRIRYLNHLHEVKRDLSLLMAFSDFEAGVIDAVPSATYVSSQETGERVQNLLQNINLSPDKYVVIAPGSVWPTKRWTQEGFSELASSLIKSGVQCVLTGGREDVEICNSIANETGAINFAGMTSLPDTIEILRHAACAVTNDSAPTHFANLVNCPVVTIFGATSPIFGFHPIRQKDSIIENNKLKCRPCEIHGNKKCPIGTLDCMKSIGSDIVFKEVSKHF